jgi:hypothetical protein
MKRLAAWIQQRLPEPHPGLAEIVAWCNGKSDPSTARHIAVHLVSCGRCRQHVALLHEGRRKLLFSGVARAT